jgi:hypothetical protein
MNPVQYVAQETDDKGTTVVTPIDDSKLCRNASPQIFYWLMFNILVFYLFFIISVCFFFRKYCQDQTLVKDMLKQE